MGTEYFSRELEFLTKARQDLLSSNCATIDDKNLQRCASIASEPLVKFRDAWDSQAKNYSSRKKFNDAIRTFFGDYNSGSGGIRALGVMPFFACIGFFIGIVVVFVFFMKRNGHWLAKGEDISKYPERPNDLVLTIVTILSLIMCLFIVNPILWTFGIMARYESSRMSSSLNHDSDGGSRIYNNPTFGKIWSAIKSDALKFVYNCAHGLDPLVDIDIADPDAKCTANGLPSKALNDNVALLTGLRTLVDPALNIGDFDQSRMVIDINAAVATIKSYLTPQVVSTARLSTREAENVVAKEIVAALLLKADYRATGSSDRAEKQEAFVRAMESDLVPSVQQVVLKYWPQVDPEVFMDVVDDTMTEYYDANITNYYSAYLRNYVLTVFRTAVTRVEGILQSGTQYASLTQFQMTSWPRLLTNLASVKMQVNGLKNDVSKYVESFVPLSASTDSLSSELTTMYINNGIVAVSLGVLIFLVYYLGIVKKDAILTGFWNKGHEKDGAAVVVLGDAASWYSRMDVIKYVLAAIAAAMIVITILASIKKKSQVRASHNANALYHNTLKLRNATKALAAVTDQVQADMAAKKQMPDPAAFYRNAVIVIETYNRCNFIVKGGKVPFPTVEIVVYCIFLVLLIIGIFFVTTTTAPYSKLRDVRDLINLREKLKMFTSSVPASLQGEIDSRVACIDDTSADVLKILSFFLVVSVFALNTVLVANFNRSANDYAVHLNTLAADMCI